MTQRERPVSPHLQVYRWQITMTMSILHRATGVALSLAAFVLAWWLVALAAGGDTWQLFASAADSLPGRVILLGFAFCLVYHLLNGVRHLFWDIGWGYEIPQLYASGWTVAALTLLVTAAIGYAGWNAGAGA